MQRTQEPSSRPQGGRRFAVLPLLAALGLSIPPLAAAPLKLDFASNAANTAAGWTPVTGFTLANTMVNVPDVGGSGLDFTFDHVACWDNGQVNQPLTRSGFFNWGQLANEHGFTLSGLSPGRGVKLYACAGWDGNGAGGFVVFGDSGEAGVKAQTIDNPGTAPTLANLTYIGKATADGTGTVAGSLHGRDGVGLASEGQVGGFWFVPDQTVTASAGPNGSISPSGPVVVEGGEDQGFTVTANSGFHVTDVLVDGVSVGAVSSYTFNDVAADHTISVSFAANTVTHTITASAGANGSISPSGAVAVNAGVNAPFTITPDEGYRIAQVLVDGVPSGTSGSYTFTNVSANHTIGVTFEPKTYTITASSGPNGSISPAGEATVTHGDSQQFIFTPDAGYQVAEVLVDGQPVSDLESYWFDNITADHEITVSFDNRTRLYLDFTNGSSTAGWTPVYGNYVADTPVASASDINGLGYAFSINHVGAYDNNQTWEPLTRSGFYTFGNETLDHTFTLTGLNAGQSVTLYACAAWDGNPFGGYVVFGDSGESGVKAQTIGTPGEIPVLGNLTVIGTATADAGGTVSGSLHGRAGVGSNLEGQVGGFVFAIAPGGTTLTPYQAWAGSPPNSLVGNDALPGADPDHDGVSNLLEFALDGSPADGASQGRHFGKLATVDGDSKVLTLTVAVRHDAVFAADGTRMKATSADGVTYTIEGSATLATWGDRAVTEVMGDDAFLIQGDYATPSNGWSLRTFRLAGNTTAGATGFLRVTVD